MNEDGELREQRHPHQGGGDKDTATMSPVAFIAQVVNMILMEKVLIPL